MDDQIKFFDKNRKDSRTFVEKLNHIVLAILLLPITLIFGGLMIGGIMEANRKTREDNERVEDAIKVLKEIKAKEMERKRVTAERRRLNKLKKESELNNKS